VAILREHRAVHLFVRSLAVVLVAVLFKAPVESDSTQPFGSAVRLTRGGPQRLESTDVVAHGGDDAAPVAAIGDVVEVPSLLGADIPSPDAAPAVVAEPAAIAAPQVELGESAPVAYPTLAPPGYVSRGRAPPSA
jgi:hypothetical protein